MVGWLGWVGAVNGGWVGWVGAVNGGLGGLGGCSGWWVGWVVYVNMVGGVREHTRTRTDRETE